MCKDIHFQKVRIREELTFYQNRSFRSTWTSVYKRMNNYQFYTYLVYGISIWDTPGSVFCIVWDPKQVISMKNYYAKIEPSEITSEISKEPDCEQTLQG